MRPSTSRRTAVTIPKRVAVTEVSHWHSIYDASYLRILRDLGCEIVGVSDRSARIVGERAEHFGGAPFTDYRKMIESTKPEFVIALGRHCDMPEILRFLVAADVSVVRRQVHGGEVEDYALATLRTPSGILFHNEVGYTMPTWPVNQTDGEQKVAGERLLLRQAAGGLQVIAPGRDELIAQPEDWQAGYPRAIREAFEAYGRGDPPPIAASEGAPGGRLNFR